MDKMETARLLRYVESEANAYKCIAIHGADVKNMKKQQGTMTLNV